MKSDTEKTIEELNYYFNVGDAKSYGVDEAIMLQNIKHWISRNVANNTNFHDGRYWTFNSAQAYSIMFPFWSERQIRRILQSLVRQGVILTGNYNKIAYDRTYWYSLSDKTLLPNGKMEVTEWEDQTHQTVTPIPDINTDKKTHIPYGSSKELTVDGTDINKERKALIKEFTAGYMDLYGSKLDMSGKEIGSIGKILKKADYRLKIDEFYDTCKFYANQSGPNYGWVFTPSKCLAKWNDIIISVDTEKEKEELLKKHAEARNKALGK